MLCNSLSYTEASNIIILDILPFAPILSPPTFFADTVIKLASRLMHVLREHCSLRELCGNSIDLGGASRKEKVFLRLMLPIFIRLGSGRPGKIVKEGIVSWCRGIASIRMKLFVRYWLHAL